MGHGLTEDELKALSPEEREAITAEPSESEAALAKGAPGVVDEPAVDPLKATPKVEIEGADELTEEEEAAKAKADAAAAAATAAKATPDAATEAATEAAPASTPVELLASPFLAPPVDMAKAEADLADLKAKFDAQEIDVTEYMDKRDAIKEAIHDARISAQHQQQVEYNLWVGEVNQFLKGHEAYKDPVLYDSLNAQVKKLAEDDGNRNLSNRQLLEKAHGELATRFKLADAPADPKAKADADAKAAKEAQAERLKKAMGSVPTTLVGVPPAASPNSDADEFAHIEALLGKGDGKEYEHALATLTPAQAERFLRGAHV